MERRWTLPVLAGLWIAGCGFFEFPAPERARDTGNGGSSGAGTGTGGSSGASGTSSATGGTAGDETSGGSGGDAEGGVSGTTSGAAGAGEGGAAGTNQGGTSGTVTGGVGGNGTTGGSGGTGGTGGMGPTAPVPTGLKLWLDAASLAGQGPISRWPNRVSGAEPDATQPTSDLRPVLGMVDSHPGVTFDGTRWMTFTQGFQDFSAGLTFFLVARFDAPGACTEIFQVSNGLEIDDISVQSDLLVAEPGVLLFEVGNANVGTGPHTIGGLDLTLATIVVRPSDETASIFINNIVGPSNTDPSLIPPTIPRAQNFLGSGLYLNCDPFEGVLFELLLYNRGLSTTDVALVNAYLQQKWNCCDG